MKKLSMEQLNRISVEEFKQSHKLPLVVVLDNVRSLNNIGSVFRTSDAFRVQHIALCGITATPPHRDIHKTALGAEDSVDWSYHQSTVDYLQQLRSQGFVILSVEQVDESIKLDHSECLLQRLAQVADGRPLKLAIVMGNEVDGVQDDVIAISDACIEIPQFGTKHSLNVSCAASIVIWEMFRILNPNQQ